MTIAVSNVKVSSSLTVEDKERFGIVSSTSVAVADVIPLRVKSNLAVCFN